MPRRRIVQPQADAPPPRRSERIRLRTEAAAAAAQVAETAGADPLGLGIARSSHAIDRPRGRPRNRATVGAPVQGGVPVPRQGTNPALDNFLRTSCAASSTPAAVAGTSTGGVTVPYSVVTGGTMPPRGERGAAERIRRELDKFMKDPPEGCTVELDNDNLFRWKATIQGPPGTPYEGGVFHLILVFQQDYPFTPPKALFLTKVYHCNIASTGNICMDILTTEWSPALTVSKILLSIISLLSDPNPEDPLEPILADLLKRKRADYEANARLWTSTYAVPDVVAQNPE